MFLDALCKALDQRGTLDVLRQKLKFYGETITLAVFKPVHSLNPELWHQFEQNVLTVIRQVKYDTNNENELDLVLFLNGIQNCRQKVPSLRIGAPSACESRRACQHQGPWSRGFLMRHPRHSLPYAPLNTKTL